MSRKYWMVGSASFLVVALLLAGGAQAWQLRAVHAAPATAPLSTVQQQVAANGKYMWNYSVKFVCGVQQKLAAVAGTNEVLGEPPVKPGNYATEINIHNYTYRDVPVGKKVIILVTQGANGQQVVVREPQKTGPFDKFDSIKLGPDFATLDDCNRIWEWTTGKVPPAPAPLTIGYLVILSPVDLDIDAVYTAEVPAECANRPDASYRHRYRRRARAGQARLRAHRLPEQIPHSAVGRRTR